MGQQLQQQQSIEPALDELLLLSDILTAETQTGLETNDLEPESTEVLTISTSEVAIETEQTLAETLILFMEEAEEHLATIDQFWKKKYISMKVIML